MKENWEKNFDGLEPFTVVTADRAEQYAKSAVKCGLRMEFKTINRGRDCQFYCKPDADLTEFWKELDLYQ